MMEASMKQNTLFEKDIPPGFFWLNEPSDYSVAKGLHITTDANTDFWQRTHYGFRNDNGHCLVTELEGDFCMSTSVAFRPQNAYDQCGLFVRCDEENWIKVSAEYENPHLSRLGSVVTNLGYSDWATTDIKPDIRHMWYRISKRRNDFLLQNSYDGQTWLQMRITHLHMPFSSLKVGVYACSPTEGRFSCTFNQLVIEENTWQKEG
jgi:regulation of enolase protein 1 (concanavalin A-like superfamily)